MPNPVDNATWEDQLDAEKEIGLDLYRRGVIKHLWTVTGKYEALVIYDVATPEELHRIIRSLPLWPYLDFSVESLVEHYYDNLLSEQSANRQSEDEP
jgi:muconolactone D-isomerase